MDGSAWTVSNVLAALLSLQLLLGGQGRVTSRLTPSYHRYVLTRAQGTADALSFIPLPPSTLTRLLGALMMAASPLVAFPSTRLVGAALTVVLTLTGVYTQQRMGVSYALPAFNTALALLMAAYT
jgi:hypothetical protein